MPKKRFSAFEDFPAEEGQPAQKPSSLFDKRSAEPEQRAEYHVLAQPSAPQVERIERLTPSQMVPDRFQPRRLLPTRLRAAFYAGEIDCYEAARRWLELARQDPGIQNEVERLLAMGSSFESHGQIKPITGSWVQLDGQYIFQIETGERRFWAACLQTVAQGLSQEPSLRVEVVDQPTRARQVLENRHAEPPTAVGQACEVAALILAEMGIQPSGEADEFDYFRQANQRRKPEGMWDKITPIMRVSRPRLVQLLDILELPTPLLDLADRHNVPERVLREIRLAPRDHWETLLHSAIHDKLTADEVALRAQKPRPAPKPSSPPDPAMQAIHAHKRFTTALSSLDEDIQNAVLDELANDYVLSNQGESMLVLLRDLAERIRIRQQNRMRRR